MNSHLTRIPSDLLEQIFNYLDWIDFINATLTSKCMKRLLCKIKLKKDLIVNEQQLKKLYEITLENRNVNIQSIFQHSVHNVIVDYSNTSRALKVKHIYCLASILDCVKSLVIKQEKVKHNEKAFLQVLMNKYKYIKLTIPREKYVNWISAYDLIANDRKFHVHLSVFPEIYFDDNVDDNLAFYENEEDMENQPVSIGKRALDLIETPPEIKKQKIMLTESVKRIMFDTQSSKLKLKTVSITFPDSLNKFLNPFDIYNEFNEALAWDDRSTYDHKEVIETKVFKPVGERFVHSILIDTNMKHWLLLTEVDIFLPNRKDIDSCSYDLESTELSKFSIKISKDKNQGRSYSELTIQAGCFQILATGGIYGNQDTLLGGFLGSSIPSNSIHEYNMCYTLRQPKESRCFYRLLRDYSKPGASYFAGFRSAIFADHGFQGAHPLRYYQDEKPGVINLSVIASKIICNYINKRVGKNDIAEYLRLFLKTKVVKEISNERLKTVATVADMECLVKDNTVQLGNYASTILYKMKIMEEAVGDTLNPIDITIFDLESTNDKNTKLRDLVNSGLYDGVKKQNGKIIKNFINQYGKTGFLLT